MAVVATPAQANAIDFAVDDIRQGIDGMEIGVPDGERSVSLIADDLPSDFLRPIIARACEQYAAASVGTAGTPRANARRSDPDTSKLAAWANLPARNGQRWRVLMAHLADADRPRHLTTPGMTDEECFFLLEPRIRLSSLNKRRGELVAGGWLEDSGERRDTRSGSPAIVWVPTAKAKLAGGLARQEGSVR